MSSSPAPARDTPDSHRLRAGLRSFRVYAALAFSFAWVPVMYTAFTRDKGFTPSQYLELWSVYYFSMVLAELPWGWVADRLGTRPLLVAGPFTLALSFAILGHTDSYTTCLAVMAMTGAAHAMISGADSAYLYELLVSGGRRYDALHEEAVAHRWRLFGVSAADLAGGLIAFYALSGTVAAFDLSAVIMVVAGLVALRLPSVPVATPHGPSLASAWDGLRRPGVLWVLVWYMLVFVLLRIGFQLYQPTLLSVGAEDLRIHGGMLCLLNLVAGVAAIFVARIHGRFRERATASVVLVLMGLSFAGLARVEWLPLLTPLFCLQQVSFGFLQPIGRTALNHRIPSTDRAALLSAQSLLARLAFGLILGVGSWDAALATHLDVTYLVLAAFSLLAGVGMYAAYRAPKES